MIPQVIHLTPVQMSIATDVQGTNSDIGNYGREFRFNNLYYMVGWSQAAHLTYMLQSPDGITWTILDAANGPAAFFTPGSFFDGANTVFTAYVKVNANPAPMFFKSFNLLTGLWGVEASDGTAVNAILGIYKLSGGNLMVIDGQTGPPGAGVPSIHGNIWNGAAVTLRFAIDTNIQALPGWDGTHFFVNPQIQVAIDSAGLVLHCFLNIFVTNGSALWSNRCFYQQVTSVGGVPAGAAFFDFPGQANANPQDMLRPSGTPFGIPLLVGNYIVFPYTRSISFSPGNAYPTLYYGTPINAPVWVKDTNIGGIDPDVQGGGTNATANLDLVVNNVIGGGFDAAQNMFFFVWCTPDPTQANSFARVRCTFNFFNGVIPTTQWLAFTIFDMTIDPAPSGGGRPFFKPFFQFLTIPSLTINKGVVALAFDAFTPASNYNVEARYTFPAFGGALAFAGGLPVPTRPVPEPIPLPNPCCVEELKYELDYYSEEEMRFYE